MKFTMVAKNVFPLEKPDSPAYGANSEDKW